MYFSLDCVATYFYDRSDIIFKIFCIVFQWFQLTFQKELIKLEC